MTARSTDPTYLAEILEALRSGAITLDLYAQRIRQGVGYMVAVRPTSAVANNGTLAYVLTVPTGFRAHALYRAAGGGETQFELAENPNVSGGDSQPPQNMNRTSERVPKVTVVRDPTVNSVGTLLSDRMIPGGSGGNASGEVVRREVEWILAPERTYLLRLTNRSGQNNFVSLAVEWYEEDA